MTTSQETLHMRAILWTALTPEEIRTINFAALVNESGNAIARGWTGEEIGKAAIEGLSTADDIGAVILTRIRALAKLDPPRTNTPTPPPISELHATMYPRGHRKSENATAWANKIRAGLRTINQ